MEVQQQVNLAFVHILQEWDPFHLGKNEYGPEIADTILAMSDIDSPKELAIKIKSIYEFSFEEELDVAQCMEVAQRLLFIKNNSNCSV